MPITVTPGSIVKSVLFIVVPILLLVGFVLTGYQHIPIQYTVGKCMKDYTSMVSYKSRTNEMKSADLNIESAEVLLCYGSPKAQNQNVYGGIVPYDQIWEFGANEPTRIYTDKDLKFGEVVVPKGRYSIYAIPGRWKWEVFISKSTSHWGNEITDEVRAQEIGSFEVRPQYNAEYVEELTIRSTYNEIIAEWGKTRITIPIENIDTGQEVKHTTILSKFWASL
tara:strand:- start:74762 stop:75430 length:669 start_codon:yes stop_codon:yes gene_type:complete